MHSKIFSLLGLLLLPGSDHITQACFIPSNIPPPQVEKVNKKYQCRPHRVPIPLSASNRNPNKNQSPSKAMVESLTSLVNSISSIVSTNSKGRTKKQTSRIPSSTSSNTSQNPPLNPPELAQRLQQDYTKSNYLWTGNLDLDCFAPNCLFEDPTISFRGTEQYRTNTQNLIPWIDRFFDTTTTQSILVSSHLTEDYFETRWNMVGSLKGAAWLYHPKVDVMGRTKFWFEQTSTKNTTSSRVQVVHYEEDWEIPAYQALLQLITPPDTFPRSTIPESEDTTW